MNIAIPMWNSMPPSVKTPSCMGARKYLSHLSPSQSNSSKNTRGIFPEMQISLTWCKAAAKSLPISGGDICERLKVFMTILFSSILRAICFTANDLPEPGGPNTAMLSGLSGLVLFMYSRMSFWIPLYDSISFLSKVFSALPNCISGTPSSIPSQPFITIFSAI